MTCDLARQLVGQHTYVTGTIRSLPRRTDSRSRMLHAATELFRQRGDHVSHATPVSDVVRESGAPRGSTSLHFPGGKQELTREAIASARDEIA
jgi:AcrR family transcriptional regulator